MREGLDHRGGLSSRLRPGLRADDEALWLAGKLVFHDCKPEPVFNGDPRLVDRFPAHKTLFRAPAGKCLPIGNLNSQSFATVYLNALDPFVNHGLKCRWYLRYFDGFLPKLRREGNAAPRSGPRRVRPPRATMSKAYSRGRSMPPGARSAPTRRSCCYRFCVRWGSRLRRRSGWRGRGCRRWRRGEEGD
jgi:hypothetical protein